MSIRFDRLKQIAEDVRRAPEGELEMGSWACGTSACAIGWHIRFHPDCGLRLVNEKFYGISGYAVKFAGLRDFYAVAEYCGISRHDAEELFGLGDESNDPEVVASRLEQFIRDHRESPVIEMKADAAAPVAARQMEGESV
jgi:hypothetical protein